MIPGRGGRPTTSEEGIRHFNKLVEAEKTECTVKGLQFDVDAFYCQRERCKRQKKLDAQQFLSMISKIQDSELCDWKIVVVKPMRAQYIELNN